MKHINQLYFKNQLNPSALSKDEYDYYYNYLVVADTNIYTTKVLYFDNQKYVIIGGQCLKEFNRLNSLIKNTFTINTFKVVSIGDNVINILKNLFSEKSILFTNLMTESILSRKISLQCNFDLLNLSTIANLDKIYQDLIGTIENQGLKNFFVNDKVKKPFQESLININHQNKIAFPSELISLIYWFKHCNIN
jgi:hypothetical protein